MRIKSSFGFECEKKLSTTLEDLFNQSDVIYEYQGKERKLNITYVRYFDQYMKENEIYDEVNTGVPFYHIAALLILMSNGGYVEANRLYYNDTEKFLAAFIRDDIEEALSLYQSVRAN